MTDSSDVLITEAVSVPSASDVRVRYRSKSGAFVDTSLDRVSVDDVLLALLKDLMTHSDEDCHGALIITRPGRDPGNIYDQLHRLQTVDWITSRQEDDDSWNARATPGRGPGRRRTYYQLTPAGRNAASHEAARWAPRRRTRERAQPRTDEWLRS
ncbi:PadR family transcriptional regulator [Kitasatospora sp. NPDC004615]|uniref:PadR family transcriptional regulator n=1 Tax=Kitasatospora sp. NPDC004615 TaxID=3364017 RepID=UPI0036858A90